MCYACKCMSANQIYEVKQMEVSVKFGEMVDKKKLLSVNHGEMVDNDGPDEILYYY